MRKNGFTMVELIAIIVIMASMLLIILPSINNTIKQSEEKGKEETLNSIYMAAENYLLDNYEDYKIDNVGDTAFVYIIDLINNNYMSINTLNPNNGSTFSNKDIVKITRNEDNTFHYELDYIKTLIEVLLKQYSSNNTTGLVKDATNENLYYYTGTNEEVANNFLWYGGHQWRVLEFDAEAKTLTLITQQPLTAIQPANSVWETKIAYESSYINSWLNDYFWDSFDRNIQQNILDSTFNVGIYTDVDEITITQKVGLLDENQYERAGSTNSYLDIKDYFWLGNRYDSSFVRYVNSNGYVTDFSVTDAEGVRAVIKISDLTITGGDGTLTNSYYIENKATNTDNIQVGEYINVPYTGSDNACGSDNICTFRVVSKNNESIKLILNGLLPSTSAWADNASDNIKVTDLIYKNVLNSFVENIDSNYTMDGLFGVAIYKDGQIYTNPQTSTKTANVGLPTVGEIFSGNDIDLGSAKTFVDVNTIENSNVSNDYWTMNRYSTSYVRSVSSDGELRSIYEASFANGVRPIIYLKSGTSALTFIGGEGTAQSPYTLE